MSENTSIEWADSTFNPWIGCTRVSDACDDCYAARSTPARTLGVVWGPHEDRRRTSASNWALPIRWEKQHAEFAAQHGRRRRVFCASLADVFDNEVPVQWRIELMSLILRTPHLDWLLLTKRIGNAARMLETAFRACRGQREGWADNVPANVWLGATVVNQGEADRDIPKLLATPAAVRFLSIEPMLGPVDLTSIPVRGSGHHEFDPIITANVLARTEAYPPLPKVDWVICGGESGRGARPMNPNWVRRLRAQCAAAGVPFLLKQWGEWAPPTSVDDLRFLGDLMRAGKAVHIYGDDREPDGHFRRGDDHMLRVGKKAAGRLLDGVEHNGFPTTSLRAGCAA